MSRAESPHDQWAEVGFYEPEFARQHKRDDNGQLPQSNRELAGVAAGPEEAGRCCDWCRRSRLRRAALSSVSNEARHRGKPENLAATTHRCRVVLGASAWCAWYY